MKFTRTCAQTIDNQLFKQNYPTPAATPAATPTGS